MEKASCYLFLLLCGNKAFLAYLFSESIILSRGRKWWDFIQVPHFNYLFWLCWVFVAVHGFSSCSVWACSWCIWDLHCSTRDWTQGPCIRSVESYPLDHQGHPKGRILNPSLLWAWDSPVTTQVLKYTSWFIGFPWWLRWSGICLQWGSSRFNLWVGKIPWRREWQPTPVFLPGEFHGQ